jgi:16S rRNA (uracil1498-N3)-methyltransferase
MHRIFCSNIPGVGVEFKPDARESEHLFKVFRARPGEAVELLDGRGSRASGTVIEQKMIRIDQVETAGIPAEKLHLCCALPRRQKLDSLLKQAAELGAWTIRPMRCERSVAEGNPRERWEVLLQEACKQSGNPFLPEIRLHDSLTAALAALAGCHLYFGAVTPPGTPFPAVPANGTAVFLAGPEGGFTAEEEQEMMQAGAEGISLGPWILRLETAAVAGLAALRTAAR